MLNESVKVAGGGQQYTSSESWGGGPSGTVDPFIGLRSRFDQKPKQASLAPGTSDSSTLCWGGATDDREFLTSVKNRKPSDQPTQDKDDPDKRIILRERHRWVEKVDIASEDDPDVVMITERVRLWVANGNDGKTYFLECTPNGKKTLIKKDAPIPAEAFA